MHQNEKLASQSVKLFLSSHRILLRSLFFFLSSDAALLPGQMSR